LCNHQPASTPFSTINSSARRPRPNS
jgi:hypothetical protein